MADFYQLFVKSFPTLMDGLWVTIYLTIVAMVLGTVLGVFLAIGKIYGNRIVSFIISAVIEIIRGTPLLAQLFILYFALPTYGIKVSALTAALIGFTINSGCYQAEYLRGSIESVSSNQIRAALSVGMTRWQGIFFVVLPQALRRVIPSWTNEFIYLLKYTSLSYVIGAPELMTQAKYIASRNYEFFKVYLMAAMIYLAVVIFLTSVLGWIERKVRIPGFDYVR